MKKQQMMMSKDDYDPKKCEEFIDKVFKEYLSSTNILVTGGSGFLGKRLQIEKPDWNYISSKDCDLTDKTKVKESNKATPIEIIPCELEEIKDLYNAVIDNEKPNWSKLSIINVKRKSKIKKLITFAKNRIKQSDDQNEKPIYYLERLFSSMAQDEFYCGRSKSAQYPNGYKWDFEGITSENHIVKFIERITEE